MNLNEFFGDAFLINEKCIKTSFIFALILTKSDSLVLITMQINRSTNSVFLIS